MFKIRNVIDNQSDYVEYEYEVNQVYNRRTLIDQLQVLY